METLWKRIEEFPNYSISNHGDIIDERKGRLVRQSLNSQGALKVNFPYKDGQVTRSVRRLVAEAFVELPDHHEAWIRTFDTPIQLDGDPLNVHADNIMWRPRNFAWKYARQFYILPPHHSEGPIIELDSQVQYFTVYEAAVINGLLMVDIWKTIVLTLPHVFPTGQRFWIL